MVIKRLHEEEYHQKQNGVIHPKIASVCQNISDWLKKKEKKSPDHDSKVSATCKYAHNSFWITYNFLYIH